MSKESTFIARLMVPLQGGTIVAAGCTSDGWAVLQVRAKGKVFEVVFSRDAEENGPGFPVITDVTEEAEKAQAQPPRRTDKTKQYDVEYLMHYNGTRRIEASSPEDAQRKVQKWIDEDPADALHSATLSGSEPIDIFEIKSKGAKR